MNWEDLLFFLRHDCDQRSSQKFRSEDCSERLGPDDPGWRDSRDHRTFRNWQKRSFKTRHWNYGTGRRQDLN